jgi:hypothetical protein
MDWITGMISLEALERQNIYNPRTVINTWVIYSSICCLQRNVEVVPNEHEDFIFPR